MKLENLPTNHFLEMTFDEACQFILAIRERRRLGRVKKEPKVKSSTMIMVDVTKGVKFTEEDKNKLLAILKEGAMKL